MLNLPNALTLTNLFFGCCAIIAFLNWQVEAGIVFIIISSIADFFDGFAARLLKISSPIGKELDSLADMVSFGVVPGVIFYIILEQNLPNAPIWGGINWWAAPAFILTAFACLRLAKFNLDLRQTESFIGLNTPATTIFTIGLLCIYYFKNYGLETVIATPIFLYITIAVLSWLLISEIPFFSLKIKSTSWKGNEMRYILIITALLQLFFLKEAAASTIIITYFLLSVLNKQFFKN